MANRANSAEKPTISERSDSTPQNWTKNRAMRTRRMLTGGLMGLFLVILVVRLLYRLDIWPTTSAGDRGLPGGNVTCPEIAALPVYTDATCVKHNSDQAGGMTKNENTYLTTATPDEVRRYYEEIFTRHGWTVVVSRRDDQENGWDYSIKQAQRRLKIQIEPTQRTGGMATKIIIAEQ